jgi:hypothetical protein
VPTTYIVQLNNACGTVLDSAYVGINVVQAIAWPDTLVCPGEPVVLHASGGVAYNWAAGSSTDELVLDPAQAGTFTVVVTDALGCFASANAVVQLYPEGEVFAGPDVFIDWGESAVLSASGTGTFIWSPDSALSCTECAQTHASPLETTNYIVSAIDTNGCIATDQVTVFFRGSLFVPNTFTPDGDGINELFHAITREVKTFRMEVFNRWGQLILAPTTPMVRGTAPTKESLRQSAFTYGKWTCWKSVEHRAMRAATLRCSGKRFPLQVQPRQGRST